MSKQFNVLIYNFNTKEIEPYNIMKSLINEAKRKKLKIKCIQEAKSFILNYSKYTWWGKCQYELIVNSFPQLEERKIDIYYQILMNIQLISEIFFNEIKS